MSHSDSTTGPGRSVRIAESSSYFLSQPQSYFDHMGGVIRRTVLMASAYLNRLTMRNPRGLDRRSPWKIWQSGPDGMEERVNRTREFFGLAGKLGRNFLHFSYALGHGADQVGCLVDGGAHPIDFVADFFRRAGGLLGQRFHFGGYDRETLARLSRARRLNGGIQCEQVGLPGDLGNEFDDSANAL